MSLQSSIIANLASVQADMNYLAPMLERPRNYTFEPPPGVPRSNAVNVAHRVPIHDARPVADRVSLDANGFALVNHRSAVRNFFDDEEVRRVYYPEVERVVKQATGAYRVHIFDHTTRRRVPDAQDRSDAPLAVCDATTIDLADLVPSDLVYPHRVGETYSVKYNPAHRWFYVPQMRVDEALLLKCSDTKTDVPARFTPHSAFIDPTASADAPPRESIEVRTLVFHK